jgi:hypothetical protein
MIDNLAISDDPTHFATIKARQLRMLGNMDLIPSTGGMALRSVRDWVGACRKRKQQDA